MIRVAFITSLFALASGCAAIAPGLHMSESALEGRGTPERPIRIVPVTPAVLGEQAKARAVAAAGRARDPLAAESQQWQYKVAPFDVLSVIVWDHPELTIPAGEFRAAEAAGNVVQADGTVFYPHVGVVPVAGKTLPEIRQVLTERLRKVVQGPQLDVRVAAFRGQRVHVSGEVGAPGAYPISDLPLRVADAIGLAKGFTPAAFPGAVTLVRGGQPQRLDLRALFEDGDLSQNWLLQDGDLVHVASNAQHKVFVLGEVRRPASKVMVRGHMTLAEAIGDSEGFDPVTSNPGAVYVLRGRYDAPEAYRLDASSADALLLAAQFELQPLDVVFVAPYALTSWNRVVQQILPTVQGLWQSVDLANRSNLLVTP
ncbi:MAG: polysaccharide biosynthesis/export family protein [Anaeromyxobacteraceae bacterium]